MGLIITDLSMYSSLQELLDTFNVTWSIAWRHCLPTSLSSLHFIALVNSLALSSMKSSNIKMADGSAVKTQVISYSGYTRSGGFFLSTDSMAAHSLYLKLQISYWMHTIQ